MAGLKKARDCKVRPSRVIVMVLIITASVFFLTKDKASSENLVSSDRAELIVPEERLNEVNNVLILSQNIEVNEVVEDYYASLAQNAEFVESYGKPQIYTKLGPYQDSYIVFSCYEMKIKGIDKSVPSLGSLYIERDKDGELKIQKENEDTYVTGFAEQILEHKDVQALITKVQGAYDELVASDERLKRALKELDEAYQNTASDHTANQKADAGS